MKIGYKCSPRVFAAGARPPGRAAEEAGFDFVEISDHFHPWLYDQGTPRSPGRCSARSPRAPSGSSSPRA